MRPSFYQSSLRAWYNSATKDKVREIVIFLDLNRNGVPGNSTQPDLEEAAINVIRSLSRNDRVINMHYYMYMLLGTTGSM